MNFVHMIRTCVRRFSRIGKLNNIHGDYGLGFQLIWKKDKGNHIKPDDVVAVLETDKMCIDIRAEQCGIDRDSILKERLVCEDYVIDDKSNNIDLFEYDCVDDNHDSVSKTQTSLDRIKTSKLNYNYRDNVSELSLAYIEEGNPSKALEIIQMEKYSSNKVQIIRGILTCIAYRQKGSLKHAKHELHKVVSLYESTGESIPWYIDHEKANIALLEGDYQTAKELWCKNFEKGIFESHWSSGYGLATIYIDEGDYDKSLYYCEKTIKSTHNCGIIKRRLETLKSQLDDIKRSPSTISIRKSNSPLITIIPSLNTKNTFSYQQRVYSHTNSTNSEKVEDILMKSKNIVAVTGSGISVASGLKTRQDLWQSQKWDRDECVNVVGRHKNEKVIWDLIKSFLQDADALTLQPKPNISHTILAQLEKIGFIKAIITQNVDGLHQDAGSKNVIEMHGSLMDKTKAQCTKTSQGVVCNNTQSCKEHILQNNIICKQCGKYFIPNVVLFGELVSKEKFNLANNYIANADTLLVIGTACDVAPTADLVIKYAKTGKPIIEIAESPSIITQRFKTNFIDGSSERVLPHLFKNILHNIHKKQ